MCVLSASSLPNASRIGLSLMYQPTSGCWFAWWMRDRGVQVGHHERKVLQSARLRVARPLRRVREAEQLDLRPVRQP
jgi:hypothetical protein